MASDNESKTVADISNEKNVTIVIVGLTSLEWTFFPNLSQSFAMSYQIFFFIEICDKYQDNNFPKKCF